MRSLLINELEINPKKLVPVLNYDGTPITAQFITNQILQHQVKKPRVKNIEES